MLCAYAHRFLMLKDAEDHEASLNSASSLATCHLLYATVFCASPIISLKYDFQRISFVKSFRFFKYLNLKEMFVSHFQYKKLFLLSLLLDYEDVEESLSESFQKQVCLLRLLAWQCTSILHIHHYIQFHKYLLLV